MPDPTPSRRSRHDRARRRAPRPVLHRALAAVAVLFAACALLAPDGSAVAAPPEDQPTPIEPIQPIEPIEPVEPIDPADDPETLGETTPTSADRTADAFDRAIEASDDAGTTLSIDVPGSEDSSNIVVIILVLTVLSIAPSVLILMTSFTRIVIVLSLTRNALGVPQLPPQQVIVGLSLFLTLFVMGPTFEVINDQALQPLLSGEIELGDALQNASGPLREFMLENTREAELQLFLDAADVDTPIARDAVPLTALIPAFVLSELKAAFILGFVIFVPFLVIDIVVSAVLVSLGMMMLPPTFVSLPLKLLLFILLDGWTLVIGTILNSS